MREDNGEKVLWLLAGLGLGAGIALLFAPQTGKELRRRMSRMAEDSREKLSESGEDVIKRGKQAFERSKAVVDEALDFVERGRRIISR